MIPSRPLNFRALDITLDDTILLVGLERGVNVEQLEGIKRILANCSDWTVEEVGLVTMGELQSVMEMMQEARAAQETASVPFESADSSITGQPAEVTMSLGG